MLGNLIAVMEMPGNCQRNNLVSCQGKLFIVNLTFGATVRQRLVA